MSITGKLLEPLTRPYPLPPGDMLEEMEARAKVIERFLFRISTNLSLAHSDIGGAKKEFYLEKAYEACRELQTWSEDPRGA